MTAHKNTKPKQVKAWRPTKAEAVRLHKSHTTRENLIKLIAAGNYRIASAEAVGVSKWAFYDWLKKGRVAIEKRDAHEELSATEEELAWFVEELERAEATAEAALVTRWFTEATDGDWRAAERFLAKKVPERWGDPATRLEISGPGGGPMHQVNATVNVELDAERQRKVLEALVEAGDMPQEVLDVWDSTDDIDEEFADEPDALEAAVQLEAAPRPASEAAGVPDVDDD